MGKNPTEQLNKIQYVRPYTSVHDCVFVEKEHARTTQSVSEGRERADNEVD